MGATHAVADEAAYPKAKLGSSVQTTPKVEKGDVDAFYSFDGVEPTTPGEILKKKDAPYSNLGGEGDKTLPTQATKIMYTTTDANGNLVPVTGYVVEPQVAWKGKGPRPTLIVGRGTVGQGDHCAPSRNWPMDGQPDPIASGRTVSLEGLYEFAFAKYGVRVVVTDFIGMGTPGTHTYMNRLDQAHAVLDAGRAVKELVGQENFGKIGFYGHSQGGGAAAAAVEEAANYYSEAEQANIAGAYASAPPANLYEVARNIDGSDLSGAIGFTINGLIERYPDKDLQSKLDKYLSEEGKETLKQLSNECTTEIVSKPYVYQTTRDWTKDGRSLEEILTEPDMRDAMELLEAQRIGRGKPVAPVMIIGGRYDRQVEHKQARNLAMKWCTVDGASVYYRNDIAPEIEDGMPNHLVQSITGPIFGLNFMLDRFNGKPLPESQTCKNFMGNEIKSVEEDPDETRLPGTDEYGSAIAASSHLSSVPLSSDLVPDNAPETGPSSGVEGSGVSDPKQIIGLLAGAAILAVLAMVPGILNLLRNAGVKLPF
ncbi:alpha/beta fold hydrolase [Corynebacterium aquatimens]